ncbi:hypothetical protein [Natronorubrum aibiense]|uniref:Uncharacterized protein n=1 Tax=Natronorubrum aibiense TaxID=348826 RepID=A0A5P9P2E2_9EURY|nr:hypothetical protein [Natronorubrum aibiense]QFU82299.1 hypothetical protein GCU68_07040 [Natronorubrum aibiense]
MSNDNSRGNESPDRQDASTRDTRTRTDGGTLPLKTHLEAIDHLTRVLLADVHNARSIDPDPDTRREVVRRLREIRAETSQVGLLLIGPEAAIPYRPSDDPDAEIPIADYCGSIVTTYSGPDPESLERERKRAGEDNADQSKSDTDTDCKHDDHERGEYDD